MMKKITLDVNDDGDIAWLMLPNHPGKGVAGSTAKQISPRSLIPDYRGPDIYMDFDSDGHIIGMEFLLD